MTDDQASRENLFDVWAELNGIISPDRSRFDVLREALPQCQTRQAAEELIAAEGFLTRYPVLPDWLV